MRHLIASLALLAGMAAAVGANSGSAAATAPPAPTVHHVTAAEAAKEIPPPGTTITFTPQELGHPVGQETPAGVPGFPGVPSNCLHAANSFLFGAVNAKYGNNGPATRYYKPGHFCLISGGYDRELLYYRPSTQQLVDVVCAPGQPSCSAAWRSAYTGAWDVEFDQFCDTDVNVGTEYNFTTYVYGAKEYDNALCTAQQFTDPLFRVSWASTSKYNNGQGTSWERE